MTGVTVNFKLIVLLEMIRTALDLFSAQMDTMEEHSLEKKFDLHDMSPLSFACNFYPISNCLTDKSPLIPNDI